MKTAEEWFEENSLKLGDGTLIPILTKEVIKEIQLDAYKAGMTDAESEVQSVQNPFTGIENGAVYWMRSNCSARILSARDRKTSL